MCDTLVSLTEDGVLFAKNSDRDPNEAQVLEWVSAQAHPAGSDVRCTWITIPQVEHAHAVVLSRPWWMWGAEMGANEHGVVIGNEAVFTDQPYAESGLLGMDLLRLALERSSSADEAVGVIVDLLERHGQGGACSHERPGFTYHNSFLVADPSGAIVLETAGREWAVEEVRGPGRSISNGLTIPAFAATHANRLRGRVAACDLRRGRTSAAAAAAGAPADLMAALRDHGHGRPAPVWSAVNGSLNGPCAHAGGRITSTQTTASWVADLRGRTLHWATATSAPCTSLFKPVRVDDPLDLPTDVSDTFDETSLWWRHERLHRRTLLDHGGLLARYRHARDRTEAAWLAEPPSSTDAFTTADGLESAWLADVATAGVPDRRPRWLQRLWAGLDEAAGLPSSQPATALSRR